MIERLELAVFSHENPDSPASFRQDTAAEAAGPEDEEEEELDEEEWADEEEDELDDDDEDDEEAAGEEVEYYRQQTVEAESAAEAAQERVDALEEQLAALQEEADVLRHNANSNTQGTHNTTTTTPPADNDALQDRLSHALAEAAKLKKEKILMAKDYQALSASSSAEIADLKAQIERLAEEAKKAAENGAGQQKTAAAMDELKMQLRAAKVDCSTAQEENRILQEKIEALEADARAAPQRTQARTAGAAAVLQEQNADLQKANTALQRSLDAATQALQTTPADDATADRIAELERSLRSLRKAKEGSDAESADLRTQLRTAMEDNADLLARLEQHSGAMDTTTLRNELTAAKQSLAAAQKENDDHISNGEFARLRIKELEREVSRLLRQVKENGGADARQQGEMAQLQQENERLRKGIEDMQARYQKLQNRIDHPATHDANIPDAPKLAKTTANDMTGEYHHDYVILADIFGDYQHKIARLLEETQSLQTIVGIRESDVGGSLQEQHQREKNDLLNQIAILQMQK